jgi:murein DD-endopeptidase MepM/ murein hydrolase activator NlpD
MLTQNSTTQERKMFKHRKTLRWFVILSTIPLLGVVSAFGLMPTSDLEFSSGDVAVETIALPNATSVNTGTTTYWNSERAQSGDTVIELLRRLNVDDIAASNYLRRADEVASFRKLAVGTEIQVETNSKGALVTLRYLDDDNAQIIISKQGDSFQLQTAPAQLEQRLFVRSGTIKSSLYAATDKVSLPNAVANQLVNIFSGDIDFRRDLRKGDTFNVAYEMNYSNGTPVNTGRIQAAEFVNKGHTYRAVYFQSSLEDNGDYYTPEGKNVQKAFLRSPLEFSRISSSFSKRRFHPVLKKWRSHKGTDFAAATGTKVKVTADGIVSFVGRKGGYGKVIMVKHQNRFTTVYAHLSRYTKGLRKGQRVTQGDVIGRVGSTGLASGPHLHYEFRVNGRQRNPMRVALPDAKALNSNHLAAFKARSEVLVSRLNLLRNTNFAKLD